ncbi:MAG TPA: twin-arginine translocation signal domain-containing protein, partial [Acidobacteriaceae bacterium]|nr:twin-arginine translocation signal domain-containing protein [Acidobacteriaceae bacterium]
MTSRREFLSLSALTTAGLGLAPAALSDASAQIAESVQQMQPPAKPVLVTRVTGDQTIQEAYQMLLDGQDTLDCVHHVCLGRENDPHDHS